MGSRVTKRKILCFGDRSVQDPREPDVHVLALFGSLTAGYHQWGRKFSPYGDTLQKLLGTEKFEVHVVVGSELVVLWWLTRCRRCAQGHSGWTSSELVEELETTLAAVAKKKEQFNYVFILAGACSSVSA